MKRILAMVIFCLILAGCGNKAADNLTSYKEAVLNEDSSALISLVEMEDEELTEDEAEAYFKLINEMYSEEEFTELVDKEIERMEAKAKSGEIKPDSDLGFEFLLIENDGEVELEIPRYKIGLDLPSSTYQITAGVNDLTVENPHGNNYQEIGVYVPGIYKIEGTATKDTVEGDYSISIDFTKPQNERASIDGNVYSFRIDQGYSNTTIKKVFVNGEEVSKNENDMYSVKLENNTPTIKTIIDFQGKEVESKEVKQDLKYIGINSIPLEIDESKLQEAEEDNKSSKGVENTITSLFEGTATGLSLTSADAAVKKALIKNDFADNDVHAEYEKLIDKYAEKGAKFEFSVPTTKKLSEDKNDFTYEVSSELTKDGKPVDSLKFEMEFVKKNDKMLIKSVKEVE
ncbi:hypothetical protein GCM10007358_12350 [Phocicoccus schoeneichii]|uniref:TcaA second domain-containing protein n=1 Tax=Phocicoccus schoeneichii TaxID=1812261 RepID=A0A6V7R9H0_9BACL|nr:hypothetical protein [Jeotgalicoccus schoeneichii]GGH53221.1 hypothetical protein GCM10007358_12350 [Jeotgalicoccus schoeneichii]CAD2073916.1 hypothetical protein JEOSCH030_00585 [Jeotgalicoccus schoeneichii]